MTWIGVSYRGASISIRKRSPMLEGLSLRARQPLDERSRITPGARRRSPENDPQYSTRYRGCFRDFIRISLLHCCVGSKPIPGSCVPLEHEYLMVVEARASAPGQTQQ